MIDIKVQNTAADCELGNLNISVPKKQDLLMTADTTCYTYFCALAAQIRHNREVQYNVLRML